jgi:hypothetical protein
MKKELLIGQNYLMVAGTLFAGYNFVMLVLRYMSAEGSWLAFKAPGGLIHPLATPCFYGFLAFLIGLIWTTKLRIEFNRVSQSNLIWLLGAATIFAWGNYGYTLGRLYLGKSCNLGCPLPYFGVPFLTACLVGAIIFTTTLLIALRLKRREGV